ncbi:hypothetical protein DSO57_1016670 [Entomophthora muscae]|uniref:Uncharacterized protein n=2 Tax=Entomophthora muscae TaxID=34485 RepID=A0ACC2UFI7_9FUNG|nr:hypothetical protein DSO57_1034053 [Entomophthora muscae]KAJ9085157.1 hypothetical protein DSO57_1016670 [Entomophthora muscae]
MPLENRRRIIIAFDNSKISRTVLDWAKGHVFRPNQDHVTIVTVTEDGESYFEPTYFQGFISGKWGFEERQNYLKELSEKAENTIAELSAELAKMGITSNPVVIKAADAKKSLVEATVNYKADMLIVGSRGLHGLKRAVLGSVSEYCINHCECPVLVHKGNTKA